jgi:hypothetical protein
MADAAMERTARFGDGWVMRAYISAFASAGCDEIVWFPCSNDLEQVELLAAARA